MRRLGIFVAAVALLALQAGSAFAQTPAVDTPVIVQTTDNGVTATTVVTEPTTGQKIAAILEPYEDIILKLVIGIVVGWAGLAYTRITGKNMDAKDRESLHAALNNGAGLLIQKTGSLATTMVDLHLKTSNPNVREAIDYVTKAAPDAIERFKLTPSAIAEKLEAKLGQMTPVGNSGHMPVAPS